MRDRFMTWRRQTPRARSWTLWPLRLTLALLASGLASTAQAAHLQCVPYARQVSGIEIYGNAKTWWNQADGRYERGNQPVVGAVLAFEATRAMPYGHVAAVGEIIDERHIRLDHANWSGPGKIEHSALAVDVSEAGDWSEVRVWFAPIGALGSRTNPVFGFIYADGAPPEEPEVPVLRIAESEPLTITSLSLSDAPRSAGGFALSQRRLAE